MLQRRSVYLVTLLCCLLASSTGVDGQQAKAPAELDLRDGQIAVLLFIASDCPISNRLIPEMLRIEKQFGAMHFHGSPVEFFFVYPNVTETPATIHAHQAAFGIAGPVLTDPQRRLGHLTGAQVTPEAAVLMRERGTLHTVYLGRIDDRFLSLGTERPSPTRHDLAEALAAALDERPVPAPGGPPVGCAIIASK